MNIIRIAVLFFLPVALTPGPSASAADCPGTCGIHYFQPTGAAAAGTFSITTTNPAGYADLTLTAVQTLWSTKCGLDGVECDRATCKVNYQFTLNVANVSGGAGSLEVGYFDPRGVLYGGLYKTLDQIMAGAFTFSDALEGSCGLEMDMQYYLDDSGGNGQTSDLYEPGPDGGLGTGMGGFGVTIRCNDCES